MKIILSSNTDWHIYNHRKRLAHQLRDLGWEVAMMSPPGVFVDKIEAAGIRWIRWGLGRKTTAPWSEISAIREAARIYKVEKPDIVHHHTIKPGIYGSIAARRAGVPAIVNSISGRGYVFIGGGLRARSLRGVVRWMYRRAFKSDNVRAIFENKSDLDYFVSSGLIRGKKTVLIESVGVDVGVFKVAPEPEGPPVIMMAARMLWDKGVQEFVEAAHRLGAPERVRFVLVGDPDPGNPSAIPRERLEAWNAQGVVEWWGFRNDMADVISRCHIFALPTKYNEGLPVSLLEAAATGRPVVTTFVPGAQDFVLDGETGILVPPGDTDALTGALDRLIRDDEMRARMGAAGRKRVEKQYTSEIINERTQAVYHSLVIQ